MRPRSDRNPKSSFATWGRSAAAIASLTATVAIVAPARAAVLHDWAFDPGTRAFTFTLPSGITPEFFLMAEPARIVLAIPDTTLGTVTTAQQYPGAVRSIRLSDVAGGARVVVELAPNTRLDPRHAELTPTTLDNGQTAWTLRPLLQDAPVAPVATAPATPAPTEPPTSAAPLIARPTAEPEVAPPAPTAVPPPVETTAEPTVAQSDAPAATSTDAVSVESAETDASSDVATEPAADLPTSEAAAIAPGASEAGVPITVTPSPDASPAPVVAPDRSVEPDIATSATTGAAQSLPTGPDPLAGISTEADRLTASQTDSLSDLPPEQLPRDASAPSSPLVSVPDLAEVPAAPAAPNPAAATAPAASPPPAPVDAPEQPPTAAPPAVTATVPPPAPATAPSPEVTSPPPEPAAIAVNSLEVPTIPLPPESWRDRAEGTAAPSAERLPTAAAIAPPPTAIAAPPPAAPAAPATATTSSPPPAAAAATPPAAPTAPPFLSSPPPAAAVPPRSPAAPPPPGSEPLTIPPPPTAVTAPNTVPFGTPLPQTESPGGVAPSPVNRPQSVLPPGTRLSLQYVGETPLVIAEPEPVYEVLLVAQPVYDPATGAVLLPVGTQVMGRFEQVNELGRRFVAQSIVQGSDRLPLVATSGRLAGMPQPDGVEVALGSGIGAAAMTLLTGFSGIGLLGGAAMGAFAGLAESPPLVTIAPGTVIQVQVVADSLPISTPPPAVSPTRP